MPASLLAIQEIGQGQLWELWWHKRRWGSAPKMRRFLAHACVLCRFRSLFFVRFAGLSVRCCFQPREVHKSRLRRDFVLQSCAVRGHCANCIQQSRVVTEPQRRQRVNMLCADLDSLPAILFSRLKLRLILDARDSHLCPPPTTLAWGPEFCNNLLWSQLLCVAFPTAAPTFSGTALPAALLQG